MLWDDCLLAGHMIQRQKIAAIRRCPKYVVVWSKHARNPPWVSYELELLRAQRVRDTEHQAFDNCVIFYCLDGTSVPSGHADELCIVEKSSDFRSGAAYLAKVSRRAPWPHLDLGVFGNPAILVRLSLREKRDLGAAGSEREWDSAPDCW